METGRSPAAVLLCFVRRCRRSHPAWRDIACTLLSQVMYMCGPSLLSAEDTNGARDFAARVCAPRAQEERLLLSRRELVDVFSRYGKQIVSGVVVMQHPSSAPRTRRQYRAQLQAMHRCHDDLCAMAASAAALLDADSADNIAERVVDRDSSGSSCSSCTSGSDDDGTRKSFRLRAALIAQVLVLHGHTQDQLRGSDGHCRCIESTVTELLMMGKRRCQRDDATAHMYAQNMRVMIDEVLHSLTELLSSLTTLSRMTTRSESVFSSDYCLKLGMLNTAEEGQEIWREQLRRAERRERDDDDNNNNNNNGDKDLDYGFYRALCCAASPFARAFSRLFAPTQAVVMRWFEELVRRTSWRGLHPPERILVSHVLAAAVSAVPACDGVDVDDVNVDTIHAKRCALESAGHPAYVRRLLATSSSSSDGIIKDEDLRRSLLLRAASMGHAASVQLLLPIPVPNDERSTYIRYSTALELRDSVPSISNETLYRMRCMLYTGEGTERKYATTDLLMCIACYLGHLEVVRVLANVGGATVVRSGHDAPLFRAACGGRTAVVEALLRDHHDADINPPPSSHCTIT